MGSILEFKGILKIYPDGTVANRNVSMEVEENTIHAVVGENGAGKTTLMKILFGITQCQGGEILFKGKPLQIKSPNEAIASGIGMVHQHLMLAPDLSVAENIVLGVEPRRFKLFLDYSRALEIAREVSSRFGLEIPGERPIRELPIGVRQRVEILKALYREAELLILDEPTAVLTPQETEILFDTLLKLKKKGKTILFISHKLKEVTSIADRVTVMRDSTVIATRDADALTEESLACLMVGRDIVTDRATPPVNIAPPKLSVRGLSYRNDHGVEMLKQLSLDVRGGEILGVAGVEGNGQSELSALVAGLLYPTSGSIWVDNCSIAKMSPREIRRLGVAHIPEDRMDNGIAGDASVQENIIVDRYYKKGCSNTGILNWDEIGGHALDLLDRFKVLARGIRTPVSALSGGNIQKLIVARELSAGPAVLVAAQPTRGVDVGSEELIHRLLIEARDSGVAILLFSADLDEILKLSTRIVVIYQGEITAHFEDVGGVTDMEIGPYMLGVKREEGVSGQIFS